MLQFPCECGLMSFSQCRKSELTETIMAPEFAGILVHQLKEGAVQRFLSTSLTAWCFATIPLETTDPNELSLQADCADVGVDNFHQLSGLKSENIYGHICLIVPVEVFNQQRMNNKDIENACEQVRLSQLFGDSSEMHLCKVLSVSSENS